MKALSFLLFILAGGVIGFSINFTWSFQQNLISFSVAFILYFVAGLIYSKKAIELLSYKTLLLFWYIISLITYSLTVNYSWDLPILLIICILSFIFGYILIKIKNKKISFLIFIVITSCFTAWLLFEVPWISYNNKTNLEYKKQKIEYQLYNPTKFNSPISDSTLNGKVVLFDFWYKSCGICIKQYPKIEAVYDYFKNNNEVAIYFVNNGIDSTETILDFINHRNIQIPVLIDKNSILVKKLKLDGFPSFVLIDKQGYITEIHSGYSKDETTVFEELTIKKIELLLKQK